jgi:hypothetical protein
VAGIGGQTKRSNKAKQVSQSPSSLCSYLRSFKDQIADRPGILVSGVSQFLLARRRFLPVQKRKTSYQYIHEFLTPEETKPFGKESDEMSY